MPAGDDRTTGRGHRLDRERILDTAMWIVDQEGMGALSMRRLGADLSVDPMAVYYHLPNKQAIISGLVQRVFEDIARSSGTADGTPWQERIRQWALTYHRVARAHSNLIVYLVSNAGAATDSVMHANEALYAALTASGLPARDIVHAADTIVDYIHGVVLGDATPETTEDGWRSIFLDHIEAAPPERFPALRQVLSSLNAGELDLDVEFGLDTLIAGLERHLKGG